MPRFLIEVPHEADEESCLRAIKVLLETGSHFLTKADFGCKDGEHKAWIIVDVDNKNDAKMILPRVYRNDAKIVQLNVFSLEAINDLLSHHES